MISLIFDKQGSLFNTGKVADSSILAHRDQGNGLNSAYHRDDLYSFGVLLEGAIEVNAGGKTFLATRHDAFCSGPGLIPRWGRVHAQVQVLVVLFEDSDLHNMNLPGNLRELFTCFQSNEVNFFRLSTLNAQEVKHELQSLQLDIQSGNAAIAAARLRLILECVSPPPPHGSGKKLYSIHTVAFQKLLHQHFLSWHTVQQYADHLFITAKHLSKLVSDELGYPPKYWINKQLIYEARRRLLHTNQPIKRIADELGYGDVYRFSKVFKNFCGCAPGHFRKSSLDKNIELDRSYVENKIYG